MDYKERAFEIVKAYFLGAWAPASEEGLVATIAQDLQKAYDAGLAKGRENK